MRITFVAVVLAALGSACALDDAERGELEAVEQEGRMNQGRMNQGTLSQGTVDAVWGFRFTNWMNSGMRLKLATVSSGFLTAAWDRTDACLARDHRLTRACDWYGAGWSSCTPGAAITVSAGGCRLSPARPSMVRVCAGSKPCAAADALGASDAACAGTANPSVRFRCPASGRYFVMAAEKASSTTTFGYSVAAQPAAAVNAWLDRDDIVGTTLDGLRATSTVVRYRLAARAVVADDPSGRSDFYTVVEDADGATPLCAGTDNRAIPIAGRWKNSGTFQVTSGSFTFACTAGVLAKCYRLGYRPWDVDAGGRSLRDYHQTCTRAARADFCGDGSSYTLDGTLVDVYDRLGHVNPVANDGLTFEAVWAREGFETSSNDVAAGRAPVCLAKKRWDTLPYDGAGMCADLNDPRTTSDDVGAAYCDDRGPSGWWALDASNLIATESAYNDAGLWRWQKSAGSDFRSTTLCTTTARTPCSTGYRFGLAGNAQREPVFIGAVYNKDGAPSARPPGAIPLYSFRHATSGDYVTTTDAAMSGYGSRTLEGYVLDRSCETTSSCPAKRLVLMVRNGDYLTTTATAPVPGYTLVKILGYLPR